MQIPIDRGIGNTFAHCLRSILRQDPDKILVGEIRDLETAEIAVQASLTGHMVFSTLHTNDAPSTITRLRDMGVPPFLITATLEAMLAQRLVRKICAECREQTMPSHGDPGRAGPHARRRDRQEVLPRPGLRRTATTRASRAARACSSSCSINDQLRDLINQRLVDRDQLRDACHPERACGRLRDDRAGKGLQRRDHARRSDPRNGSRSGTRRRAAHRDEPGNSSTCHLINSRRWTRPARRSRT